VTDSIPDLVESYLSDCRARGLSIKTVERAYGYPLRSILVPWSAKAGIWDAEGLTREALNQLSTSLLAQGLSPYSVTAYLRPVNQLLKWAGNTARSQYPKRRPTPPDVLTQDEAEILIKSTKVERDRILLRLLWETGARIGEVANLTVDSIVVRDRMPHLKLDGKTGQREAGMGSGLYADLMRYVKSGRPETRSKSLFMSRVRRRGTGDYAPLEQSGIYQIVKEAAAETGLDKVKRVHPHLFRKSRITHLRQNGVDMETVVRQLGVSAKVIIEHYSFPSVKDQYEAIFGGRK